MRKYFIFLLLSACASLLFAQQNKLFTLDELIPGGENFYSYYPRIDEQFQWHGDELMMLKGDSVFQVDPANSDKKKFVFRFDEIRKKIGNNGKISNVKFDREGDDNLLFSSAGGTGVYNLKTRQVILSVNFPENGANRELSPDNIKRRQSLRKKTKELFTDKRFTGTSSELKAVFFGRPVETSWRFTGWMRPWLLNIRLWISLPGSQRRKAFGTRWLERAVTR